MGDKVRRYEGSPATITWDASRCIHAAECVRRVPQSFDPAARPWIQPDKGDAATLADAVNRCPSGALSMKYADGTSAMVYPDSNTCDVTPNGPNYLRGSLVLKQADEVDRQGHAHGAMPLRRIAEQAVLRQRHKKIGFAHAARCGFARPRRRGTRLYGAPDAPTMPDGPMQMRRPADAARRRRPIRIRPVTPILCRCGGSQQQAPSATAPTPGSASRTKTRTMPSFDIVSEVNQVEVNNAIDQANKEITNRFDFKGSDARIE